MANAPDVSKAEDALLEAEHRVGKDHIEVSHRLDDLAEALKANGRALDAANARARAKAIRKALVVSEEIKHEAAFGSASAGPQPLSATAWMWKLHRIALVGSGLLTLLFIFLPHGTNSSIIVQDLIGSSCAATFFQLLLFPVKSIPRVLKYIIVAVAASIVWAGVSQLKGQ